LLGGNISLFQLELELPQPASTGVGQGRTPVGFPVGGSGLSANRPRKVAGVRVMPLVTGLADLAYQPSRPSRRKADPQRGKVPGRLLVEVEPQGESGTG